MFQRQRTTLFVKNLRTARKKHWCCITRCHWIYLLRYIGGFDNLKLNFFSWLIFLIMQQKRILTIRKFLAIISSLHKDARCLRHISAPHKTANLGAFLGFRLQPGLRVNGLASLGRNTHKGRRLAPPRHSPDTLEMKCLSCPFSCSIKWWWQSRRQRITQIRNV